MLVKCPNCFKEYRINLTRVMKTLVQVKCPFCSQTVMVNVKKLQEGGTTTTPTPFAAEPPRPAEEKRAASAVGQKLAAEDVLSQTTIKRFGDALTITVDGKPQKPYVLIADEPRTFRDFLARSLQEFGCDVHVVDDGLSAEQQLSASVKPQIVFLNVVLKHMMGYVLCEKMKNDPNMKTIKVVLIGAIFRINRFKRNPSNLYGADDYIEEIIVKQELKTRVRMLLGLSEEEATAPEEQAADEVEQQARRLARIILSDIVIYNRDRIDQLIQSNKFFEELTDEIKDGKDYFLEKIMTDRPEIKEIYNQTINEYVRRRKLELNEK